MNPTIRFGVLADYSRIIQKAIADASVNKDKQPAADLSYLLHKHPDRFQSFELSFGTAHVFYPEVGDGITTAALLLDVDPVGMVRGKNRDRDFSLGQYVNDRPYVSSSFMSVAISQVFSSAMSGRCKDRPDLVTTHSALGPDRGVAGTWWRRFLHRMFEPLGYTVEATRHVLDAKFPDGREPVLLGIHQRDENACGAANASVRPHPGV